MIIAFDGNIFVGKTSLIEEFLLLCVATKIEEHSLFLKSDIPSHSVTSRATAISLQLKYLEAERDRCAILDIDRTNFLDRSFISMAAHVFALYRVHGIDIRKWFLQEMQERINLKRVIIPDVFCYIKCSHGLIRKRISKNRSRNPDSLYYVEDYLCAVDDFNSKWSTKINGIVVDTETIAPIRLVESLKKQIFVSNRVELNTQHICVYLRDILMQ